jgi:hypothetical protein
MLETIQNNINSKQWLGRIVYLNYVGVSSERQVRVRDQAAVEVALDLIMA